MGGESTGMETSPKVVSSTADPKKTEDLEAEKTDGDNVPATDNGQSTADTKGTQLFLLVFSLFLGVFVMALDQTIVGTAVPAITTQFNSLDDIAWYGSGYLLTITAFQPTFGKLYRIFNVKLVFMACVLVFEVGSILCAAAPSSAAFIAGRAIAGTGAAGLFQGALAIITRTIKLEKRPLCISVVTSTFAVSVAIGPVIGGVFSDQVTWRWCFWINVPIGGVVLILITFLLRVPEHSKDSSLQDLTPWRKLEHLDPLGSLLIIGAVVSLLLALQWGGQSLPWNSATVIGLLVGFVLITALFFVMQWRQGANATLPLALLNQRSILAGALFSFFYSMPTYVYGYYIPIYFQAAKGTTATESGIRFLALAIPQVFAVVFSGALVTVLGVYMPFMIVGTAIGLTGCGLFLLLGLETSRASWAVFLVICGVGTGISINLPYTLVQAVLTEDIAPTGNAAFQFMFQLGGALSLSISQTIFLNSLQASDQALTPSVPYEVLVRAGAYNLRSIAPSDEIYNRLRQVYLDALHDTYIFPIVVAGLALLLTFAIENKNLRKVSAERKQTSSET
ncbi:major facilitator superfamily domain-containing protein [Poronia punctata]|nr:major facilitator superfamily domain-containing protein [Poronia punctata]